MASLKRREVDCFKNHHFAFHAKAMLFELEFQTCVFSRGTIAVSELAKRDHAALKPIVVN